MAMIREAAGDLDVVVTDVGMPGTDGYEFLATLKADPVTATLPVIALTGRVESEHRTDSAGFAARLTKPVDPVELANVVTRVVEQGREGAVERLASDAPVSRT